MQEPTVERVETVTLVRPMSVASVHQYTSNNVCRRVFPFSIAFNGASFGGIAVEDHDDVDLI